MSTICPDRPADIIPPVSTEIASAVEVDSRPATVAVEASTSYVVDCNEGIIKLFRTAFSRELNCRSVTVEPDVIVIHVRACPHKIFSQIKEQAR